MCIRAADSVWKRPFRGHINLPFLIKSAKSFLVLLGTLLFWKIGVKRCCIIKDPNHLENKDDSSPNCSSSWSHRGHKNMVFLISTTCRLWQNYGSLWSNHICQVVRPVESTGHSNHSTHHPKNPTEFSENVLHLDPVLQITRSHMV